MAKLIIGTVSSNKNDKTIVVTVQTRKTHPLYRKQYLVTDKFMAHDEKNSARVGDRVVITESRPISARKRFVLSEILEKPKLRQENLEAITTNDTGKRSSKSSSTGKETDAKEADAVPEVKS